MEEEKLLYDIKLLIFTRKFREKMESFCRKFFEEFFNQFFVNPWKDQQMKKKRRWQLQCHLSKKTISKFQSCLQLNFFKGKFQNFQIKEIIWNNVKVRVIEKRHVWKLRVERKGCSKLNESNWIELKRSKHHKIYYIKTGF